MRQLKRNRFSTEKGFTLIEMAIVISIVGIFMAALAQIYVEIKKAEDAEDTRTDVTQVTRSIADFRSINGRYPCPAPLTANYGDAEYGRETDCSLTSGADYSVGTGITGAGIAVVPGEDTGATRVRVGTIPFRDLNIPEEQSYDGYRNRIIYAVTEPLAVSSTFTPNGGAISILNAQGTSAIEPANSGHFIVFSAGENGAGAYNTRGVLIPCEDGAQESINCNFTEDAEFVFAQTGTSGDGETRQYDDEMLFATHKDIPLWESAEANKENISMKPHGGLGVGYTASEDPKEDLQIDGIIRAQDDPTTENIEEGKVHTQNLCDYASDTDDCFTSSLIGGKIIIDETTGENIGGGMKCPEGTFMTGIRNSEPICESEIRITCPEGKNVIGINADGSLDCGVPPEGCPTTNVDICDTQGTLFAGPEGTIREVTGGQNKVERYICESNGSWSRHSRRGLCGSCQSTAVTKTKACEETTNCGNVLSGTKTVQEGVFCPEGRWQSITIDDSGCTCKATSKIKTVLCPEGFNRGEIKETYQNTCNNGNPSCQKTNTENTCACEEEYDERDVICTGSQTGTYKEERRFICPGGTNSPGDWTDWTEVPGSQDANCQCQETETISYKNCGSGEIGQIKVTTRTSCPPGTPEIIEDDSECQPAPPVHCTWDMASSTGITTTNSSGTKDGESCDCGSGTTSCKKFLDGNTYEVGICICK